MHLAKTFTSLSFIAALASASIAGNYMPQAGEKTIGVSVTHTSFDRFWAGSDKQPGVPGGGNIERTSYRTYLFYGIKDDLALDLSIGYADTSSALSSGDDFTDSQIGLSWQLANEGESAMDWMVRAGVNIGGGYETGFLSAPGDGENGLDFMTKFGRAFGSGGARGDLEIGYTFNDGQVPDSFRLRGGPSFPLGQGMNLDFSGIFFQGVDGIDIGGPGFSGLIDLPRVKERAIAGEVGFSFNAGGGYYRLSVSQIFDGENIGEEFTFGVFAGFGF